MRCSEALLDALHERKGRGDSYEDVVWRLLDKFDERPVEPEVMRERIAELDWNRAAYAKTEERVAVVAAVAVELASRTIAGKQALRRVVRESHDIDDGTLQRLCSDLLPQLDEVSQESQVYEWR